MARQIPRLAKGVFTSMMWTGLAVKLFDGPRISRDLVEADGQHLQAMPLQHAPERKQFVAETTSGLTFIPGSVPLRHKDSLVHRYKVNSIPPKVDVASEKDAKLRKRLAVSRDGLHRTMPWDLWKHNIGANAGLMDVIKQYMVEVNLEESRQYHVWLVDVNIYSRVYKVLARTAKAWIVFNIKFVLVHVRSLRHRLFVAF